MPITFVTTVAMLLIVYFRFLTLLYAFILLLYGGCQEDCEDHPNKLKISRKFIELLLSFSS